jgi:hypothetical protein
MDSTPTDRAAAAHVFDHKRGYVCDRAGLRYVFDHKRGNVTRTSSRLRPILASPQSGVPRPQDRLCPVPDLKLGEDRGQVVGDGLR